MLSMPVLKLTCFIAVKDQVTGVAPVVVTKCATVGTGLQNIKIEVLILCMGCLEREKPGILGLILHPYSLFCPFPPYYEPANLLDCPWKTQHPIIYSVLCTL